MTKNPPEKETIQPLFDAIAPVYDFLNHFLSFGIDTYWRNQIISTLLLTPNDIILDAACGTGALSHRLLKKYSHVPFSLTGVDFSEKMIDHAMKTIHDKRATFIQGDVETLPFEELTFHHVMIAFGVRNLENLSKGLHEMYRVLKKEGTIHILEFSVPPNGLWRRLFHFYFHKILPPLGKWISGHSHAYTYLPKSVEHFLPLKEFTALLTNTGFHSVTIHAMTGGVCTLYVAQK
ncbi:MAG: bifunctional demethylmenaquinone methyltransferase/2-methoxy-6-polyprenyl-1,4-benzoquinol methylase UbiE [Candidatus Marinimicrobia bacterium]|nr:bifunctional demethylmenaquinone methyltransferase/2-methoxy-6-polyprenyl-1,4-benzoquinol methylase UbiE [Candidatus Neomarinimicrobiota bacterium]MDD5582345.1 bifunctional demethylmenaquinone methyltransferase/2-methoxy-6-polyprenyl-1,4-benzoquinol methylase UbiE [Candidatus Neomarinimicrobiota bacterium]